MAVLPATGSAIKMGGVYQAYTNTAPTGGLNIRLSATLGVSYGGKLQVPKLVLVLLLVVKLLRILTLNIG